MSETTNSKIIENNEQCFLQLLDLWYKAIGQDHHKDRDCHFFIERHYCTYNKPVWIASHRGYISEYEETFNNFSEAQKGLIEFLIEAVAEQIDSNEVLAKEELEFQSNVNSNFTTERTEDNKIYFSNLRNNLNNIVEKIIW